MGKTIYLTEQERKWLETQLGVMSEMEAYWKPEYDEGIYKKMVDILSNKVKE